MNKSALTILCVAMAIATLAFQEKGEAEEKEFAKELWESIQTYASWQLAPGTSAKMPGHAPHGKYVTIYFNSIALERIESDEKKMPEGSILAKENFSSTNELESLTVMYRRLYGWTWIVYEPDGEVRRAGRLKDCIDCHSGAEKDGVFTWRKADH